MSTCKFLAELWHRAAKLPPVIDNEPLSLADLRRTEWSPRFEQLMRNRLIMGAFRYGTLARKKNLNYDLIGRARQLLNDYAATGNDEILVDIANYALLEFVLGTHPRKHFASIDDGIHCLRKGENL